MTTFVANNQFGAGATIAEHTYPAATTRLASGGFVVAATPQDGSDTSTVTIYDAEGQQVGSTIQVAGVVGSMVQLASGNIAVGWVTHGQTGTAVMTQIFTPTGTAAGAAGALDSESGYAIGGPFLTALGNGSFVAAWNRTTADFSHQTDIRTVGADNSPLTSIAVLPNAAVTDATALSNGQVVFSYAPATGLNSGSISQGPGFALRTYDPAGTIAGSDLEQAPPAPGARYELSQVTTLASGNILATWGEFNSTGSLIAVRGAIYAATGGAALHDISFPIAPSFAYQGSVAATPLDDGGFVLTYPLGTSQQFDEMAQVYDANGNTVGAAFAINDATESFPRGAAITAFGSDDFAVAYSYGGFTTTSTQVKLFYSTTVGSSANDTLNGTADRDLIGGLDGADTLHGLDGGDLLNGGAGADTLDGGNGSDTAIYDDSPAGVTINLATNTASGGTAEGDTLISIENLVGSAFGDVLVGDAGGNRLEGGAGNDSLDGGAGADILIGGSGDDTYRIDDPLDVVIEQVNGGTDKVITSIDYALPANVENLSAASGATGALTLTGSTANNIIELGAGGGSALGGSGDDTLISHQATNLLDGGDGYDVALLQGTSSFGHAGTPDITLAENGDVIVNWFEQVTVRNVEEIRISETSLFFQSNVLYTAFLRGIDAQYLAWGGRHATANELGVWSSSMQGGTPLSTVKNTIINDSLGHGYINSQVASLYQTYGGRTPNQSELDVWYNAIRNGADFGTVRSVILSDPLGHNHTIAAVTALYQTYGGRAPTQAELNVWENAIKSGADFNFVRATILNDPLGQTHTTQVVTELYEQWGGRDPTSDEIAVWKGLILNGADFGTVRQAILNDPLGQAHTTQVVTQLYEQWGGRDPTSDEIAVWKGLILNGADFGTVRQAILNDPLGQGHTSQVVTQLYQDYGGRAPTAGELAFWSQQIKNGQDFTFVRTVILDDPLGQNHSNATIAAIYQQYFNRAPTADETTVWKNLIRGGIDFDTMRDVLLSDPGSAPTTHQFVGTAGADTFHFNTNFGNAVISAFDPVLDKIDLHDAGFGTINPLDAAHAREVHQFNGTTDVLLTFNAHDSILLHNVTLAQLHSSDFLL